MASASSRRVRRIVVALVSAQVIRISNLLALLLDPRPEFLLGLWVNSTLGLAAVSVAFAVRTGRTAGLYTALLFAMLGVMADTYFQCIVVVRFGEAHFLPPLTISLVMMALNVAIIVLLLFSLRHRSQDVR